MSIATAIGKKMSQESSPKKLPAAYQQVLDVIISEMKKGIVPWRKPWKMQLPKNASTGKYYNGVNLMLLSCAPYADNRYLTFNQAKALDCTIKKGEKGWPIVFYNFFTVEDKETGEEKQVPNLKYFTVFNVEQTEGKDWTTEENNIVPPVTLQEVLDSYTDKPPIKHYGNSAHYSPRQDEIVMPPIKNFTSPETYSQTLFHELAHSTGHASRLARKGIVEFDRYGTAQYSEEELIAELAASFLCAHANIDNSLVSTASYIQGWMQVLTDHPKMIVTCSSKAQKAVDYILGNKKEKEPVPAPKEAYVS